MHMKKIAVQLFFAAVLLTGCGKQADRNGQTPVTDQNGYSSDTGSESAEAETGTEAVSVGKEELFPAGPYDAEEWHAVSAAQYFAELGIRQVPETLGGYTLKWDPDANFDMRGRNAFLYRDEAGENVLIVYISSESEHEIEEDQILLHHADDDSTAAEFHVQKAHITMQSMNAALRDLNQLSTMQALAKELKSALMIQ